MGKKKQAGALGRSIIKDRFGSKGRRLPDSHLHTSEIDDGYDWNKLNLRSVTEENSLDEFLATAQMAGTEFIAERMNIKFVSQESRVGMMSPEEEIKLRQTQDEHRQLLNIPRRPIWNEMTTASELDMKERDSFLEWRRKLAQLQDVEGLVLTPFERNLDFWRQLWRVIERSDVIVQIVDARNPLLFRAEDLERYVLEVNPTKLNMILVNKADYLTQQQREMWTAYFDAAGVRIAFWSATLETDRLKEEAKAAEENEARESHQLGPDEEFNERTSSEESSDVDSSTESMDDDKDGEETEKCAVDEGGLQNSEQSICRDVTMVTDGDATVEMVEQSVSEVNMTDDEVDMDTPLDARGVKEGEQTTCTDCEAEGCEIHGPHSSTTTDNTNVTSTDANKDQTCDSMESSSGHEKSNNPVDQDCSSLRTDNNTCRRGIQSIQNNPDVLDGPQLIDLFKCLHTDKKFTEGITTIGMVGYPNVGKSSTINALLQTKKVPVSATPGRTKHFQTLYLDETLMLCDCPGLVMPTFVNTKADMVICGILPIDQMRDYVAPVAAVCRLIPRKTFENIYGIMIVKPREGEDETRPPTPHELLAAYAYMRGYMTHKGIPDFQRAARHILKDFVAGKLIYSHSPPDCDVDLFCPTPDITKATRERTHPQPQPVGSKLKTRAVKYRNEVDQEFFEKREAGTGKMGIQRVTTGQSADLSSSQSSLTEKPWKRHGNRGKKEKLRRLHSHLDA